MGIHTLMTTSSTAAIAHLADAPVEDRLAAAISIVAQQFPDRVAIVSQAGSQDRRTIDYAAIADRIVTLERQLDAMRPIGIVARAKQIESLVVIAAACGRQHVPVAFLVEDSRDLVGELREWITLDDSLELSCDANSARPCSVFDSVAAQIVVATSGTSGPPKLIEHSWDSLLASSRLAEQWHGLGWLLVYDAARWAGLQVWLQALLTGGQLVQPASRDPDTVARAIVEEHIAILPATPTLLRRLITSADRSTLARLTFDRITLGGEAADGQLLSQAHELFPAAKITQVYATTELGEVFRVSDGLAGFPAAWLNRTLPGGAKLSMRRDGELLVQLSRDTTEVATGDLIERRGNRYEFSGRRSDVIVVGGAKVFPRRAEELLRGVLGIADARVYGLPSAITGELVAAEVIISEPLPAGQSPESIRAAALAACRMGLEPQSVPRILDIVKKIATNPAGKIPRRPTV
ncbi:MAG: long-chain fatty acid--CoA ligase [Planctomycetota bacterium]|nr:MAG: long-chain fatty acid--CoA ligase [Planctomycetota bacterium]